MQLPEVLDRVASIADTPKDDLQRRYQSRAQRRTQCLRKIGHLRRRRQVLIEALPDLVEAVGRFTLQQIGELRAARLIEGRRHVAAANAVY